MLWPSRIDPSDRLTAGLGRTLTLAALAIVAFASALPTQAQVGAATTVNLFLHGSGAAANPPTLFLDATTPPGAADDYKDSAAVNFNGGNAWKDVGSWAVTPKSLSEGDLTALGAVRIWVGLKNSDDQGTWFDVRSEVLKNGAVVASGLSRCVQDVTRNANSAKEIGIPFNAFAPASFDGSADSLVLRLSTRIGTNADDTKCGGHNNAVGLRAYFDAASRPAGFSATFLPTLAPPVITEVTPLTGVIGTNVTILGQGFDPDASGNVVTFGTTAAVVGSATATQIETTVPAGAGAGSSQVAVTTRGGTATANFAVGNPVPVIEFVSPESVNAGTGATLVTVFGSGFIAASRVSVGDSALIPALQTSTRLEVEAPASLVAALGTLEVTVINPSPGGGASNVVSFAVLGVAVSNVTPDSAPVGSTVIISGVGFDPVAANNQVTFNGTPAVVVSATDTTIETIVPAGATSGPISVTTPRAAAASAPFPVTSGATLLISTSPGQSLYSQGQPIAITTQLVDATGQNVPGATAELVSDPPADSRIGDTFVYQTDGTYTITASVDQDGEPVTASVELRVEGRGPTITCSHPIDGAMLTGAPSAVTLTGSVNNVVGTTAFTVNGEPVTIDAEGGFSTPIATTWGVNFVDLALVDGAGRPARRTCTFLLSAVWAPENQLLSNTLSFKATQAAVDDHNRDGAIDSLVDPLVTVLNSDGLRVRLHNALSAANPLKPSACDSQTCTFFGCVCWYRSEVIYTGLDLGEKTTSLTLVNGGLRSDSTIRNAAIRLRVRGAVGPIGYDTTGWVTFSSINVSVTYDLAIAAGRPRVSIRPGSVTSVGIGSISTSFGGVDGWIINNIVVPLAQGTLKNLVSGEIRDSILNDFTSALDGVVSGLDVTTLAPTFAVPRIDGASPLIVSFGVGFSSLRTTPARMLATIGTRFQTSAAHGRPSLGVALPPGTIALDPTVTVQPLAVGAHVGLFSQALHTLWRGGYFDTELSEGDLNGLIPAGVTLRTTAGLPPVAKIRSDGRFEVSLGAVQVHVDYPALLASPVEAGVGGRVSCDRRLVGNDLILENCTVDELHLSTGAALDPTTGAQLEQLISDALNAIVSTAVNDALPALPIPGFRIPATLGPYGLPAGGVLGLVNPTLVIQGNHFVLRGGFGIR